MHKLDSKEAMEVFKKIEASIDSSKYQRKQWFTLPRLAYASSFAVIILMSITLYKTSFPTIQIADPSETQLSEYILEDTEYFSENFNIETSLEDLIEVDFLEEEENYYEENETNGDHSLNRNSTSTIRTV